MKFPLARILVAVVSAVVASGLTVCFWAEPPEIVNRRPRGTQIIAFGDSLTLGIGASPGRNYPTVLSKKIGRPILNRGVAGDTTSGALARLEKDVLSRDPQIVIVFLGGNDVLQSVPFEQTFSNVDEIIRRIQARGALVVLVEVKPPGVERRFGREFRRLARARGAVLVPEVLRGIFLNPQMMSDHIHFNDAGYAVVAERIYAAMKPYLDESHE